MRVALLSGLGSVLYVPHERPNVVVARNFTTFLFFKYVPARAVFPFPSSVSGRLFVGGKVANNHDIPHIKGHRRGFRTALWCNRPCGATLHGTGFGALAILVKAFKCASGELETDV
jgi:hypothetical protein